MGGTDCSSKARISTTYGRMTLGLGHTLIGERCTEGYPIRVDRAYHEAAVDEMGCSIFGQLNRVKIHKMRWLGNVSIDQEYRSMVVYLDTKEEVDRLLAKMTVTMANGECAYTRPFVIGSQPAYRCHIYGHLHYRCRVPAPICGQCALPDIRHRHALVACTGYQIYGGQSNN